MIKKLMVIGAHPDDPELIAGGISAKLLNEITGAEVLFLSTTNGDAGHQTLYGERLAKIRYEETRNVEKALGVKYIVMNNHDGKLECKLEIREELIREIRRFVPDVIITHYADDYHPDHRNTHTLVNDSIYLLGVPAICPDCAPMRKMPSVWYERPYNSKGRAIFCDIEKYIAEKAKAAMCHESQYFDWLPWIDGDDISSVDGTYESKLQYMTEKMERFSREICDDFQSEADSFFARPPKHIEAFDICRHASSPDKETIDYLKNNL